MNKTHWSVWVTIVFTAISSILWVTIKITKIEEQVRFLNDRLDKVVNMCCDEVHKTLIKRPVDPHTFFGGFENASEEELFVLRKTAKDRMPERPNP